MFKTLEKYSVTGVKKNIYSLNLSPEQKVFAAQRGRL
jgi:hypothetical protein